MARRWIRGIGRHGDADQHLTSRRFADAVRPRRRGKFGKFSRAANAADDKLELEATAQRPDRRRVGVAARHWPGGALVEEEEQRRLTQFELGDRTLLARRDEADVPCEDTDVEVAPRNVGETPILGRSSVAT